MHIITRMLSGIICQSETGLISLQIGELSSDGQIFRTTTLLFRVLKVQRGNQNTSSTILPSYQIRKWEWSYFSCLHSCHANSIDKNMNAWEGAASL